MRVKALENICRTKNIINTEVWGKLFINNPDIIIKNIKVENKYLHKILKTSIDYPEDFEFIKCIFEELYRNNK